VAGRYTATLTVTDAQGLAATRRFDILVAPESALAVLYVRDISLRVVKRPDGYFRCIATVAVRSGDGAAAGATVTALWSGVGSKTGLALTDAAGVATLKGPLVRRRGTCSVAVSDLALPGYTYAPDKNLEGTDSLTY
jgi:hypothetical protein